MASGPHWIESRNASRPSIPTSASNQKRSRGSAGFADSNLEQGATKIKVDVPPLSCEGTKTTSYHALSTACLQDVQWTQQLIDLTSSSVVWRPTKVVLGSVPTVGNLGRACWEDCGGSDVL